MNDEQRFSRLPYLSVLLLLLAVQFYLMKNLSDNLMVIGFIQLLKLPLTVFRLNDLGRSPDDAIWTVIPLANVALGWLCLTRPTPKPERWQKLRGRWFGQLSALGAFREGLVLCRKTFVLGSIFAVGYGLISALVSYKAVRLLETFQEMEAGQRGSIEQGLWGLTGLLALYTIVQFFKRDTASRSSWFPSLFLLPGVLLGATISGINSGLHQELGLLFLNLPWQAWGLVWQSVGGAILAIVWINLAQGVKSGKKVSLGDLFGQIRSRTTDVAGAHGARVHAVLIGMQVLIPGIFYALQLAFTDMVVVLFPERRALVGSGELTWGIRQRLFKVFAIWIVVSMFLSIGCGLLVESGEVMQEAFWDLRAMSMTGVVVQELVWVMTTWILELALLAIFWERIERFNWVSAGVDEEVQTS